MARVEGDPWSREADRSRKATHPDGILGSVNGSGPAYRLGSRVTVPGMCPGTVRMGKRPRAYQDVALGGCAPWQTRNALRLLHRALEGVRRIPCSRSHCWEGGLVDQLPSSAASTVKEAESVFIAHPARAPHVHEHRIVSSRSLPIMADEIIGRRERHKRFDTLIGHGPNHTHYTTTPSRGATIMSRAHLGHNHGFHIEIPKVPEGCLPLIY